MSPEDYLVRERAARYRSEYVAGEVRALAGASRKHNQIVTNVVAALASRLRAQGCFIYANDMLVHARHEKTYFYPDLVIACDKQKFSDEEEDTLLNPRVIIEVLSRATSAFDRRAKFGYFKALASLNEYVLISQDEPLVEQFVRGSEESWVLTEFRGTGSVLVIRSTEGDFSG